MPPANLRESIGQTNMYLTGGIQVHNMVTWDYVKEGIITNPQYVQFERMRVSLLLDDPLI